MFDYALAYTSGARFGELFNLTQENIDFDKGTLRLRSRDATPDLPPFHVKDHEDREIPLPRHTLRLVHGWLRRRPVGSPFLLVTPERYRCVLARWRRQQANGQEWLNEFVVNNVMRDVRSHAKRAGLKLDGTLTIHSFRKSCGQNWANNLPMNVVKEYMGLSEIKTTAEFCTTVSQDHTAHAQWVIEAVTMGHSSPNDAKVTPAANTGLRRKVG